MNRIKKTLEHIKSQLNLYLYRLKTFLSLRRIKEDSFLTGVITIFVLGMIFGIYAISKIQNF